MTTRSLLAALFLLPSLSFGLGFRLVDHDAFATGRGGAFAATADRPSAIYYNPAGIGMLEDQQFQLGAYGVEIRTEGTLDPDETVKDAHRETVKNKHEVQAVPQFFYTAKLPDSPLSLGLGIYAPFGFGTKYPEDSLIRDLSVEASIKYVSFNPVIAWRLTDTLSIAAGPMINVAQADLLRGISSVGSTFEFKGSGVGYGFNAGILWQPHAMHSFGVNYRSASTIEFSGHTQIKLGDQDRVLVREGNELIATANEAIRTIKKTVGPFGDAAVEAALASFGLPNEEIASIPSDYPMEDAGAKIHFPQTVVVGYSFRPTPDWNLEINVDWTDWDSLNVVSLHQQTSPTAAIPFNYKSSFIYEIGATRSFKNGFVLSAGYIYSENSIPTRDFNPAVPDANRHIYSVGAGFHGKRFTCDAAYQLAYSPEREIANGNSARTSANGSWQTTIHGLSLTLGYRF